MVTKSKIAALHARAPLAAFALGALCLSPGAVSAQQNAISRPVVQALPSRESLQLNSALSRLARNPRDISALIDAGKAASAMGDMEAAVGFFRRAGQIEPNHPEVKAGLAAALVMDGDPYTAIPMFDEAVKAGADPLSIAADRGLAYDLVGQPDTAQQFYRQALGKGKSDIVSRRLALSLSISGRDREVEEMLLPLLRDQDKAAWRARAFSLAIMGKTKQAVKITQTLLPPSISKAIVPYLEYMPRLTAAQQAAAANLGRFPRASEIGRDDPRVALFKPQKGRPVQVASAGQGLVPKGRPLGSAAAPSAPTENDKRRAQAAEKARRDAEKRASRVAPPEVRPERTPGSPSETELAALEDQETQSPAEIMAKATPAKTASRAASPQLAAVSAAQEPAPKPSEIFAKAAQIAGTPRSQTPAAQIPAATETPAPAQVTAPAARPAATASPQTQPGFDLARLPSTSPSAAQPVSTAGSPSEAPPPRFSALFEDLGKPSSAAAPKAGAVDITKIEPPRETEPEPKPKAKPASEAPPSHPSRIWVQLGIGQDKSALSFDWRRFARKAPAAFKGLDSHVSKLNRTNRLLAGPFESNSRASSFVKQLEEAGFNGPFVWSSPAGQVVDKL